MYRMNKQKAKSKGQRVNGFKLLALSFKLLALSSMLLALSSTAFAKEKKKIILLIGVSNSYNISEGICEVGKIPEVDKNYIFQFYTNEDIEMGTLNKKLEKDILNSDILLVDTMYREWREYVSNKVDFKRTKVYSLRASLYDEETPRPIFDAKVIRYYASPTKKNIKNLLLFLLRQNFHLDLEFKEPITIPASGIFHPDGTKIFTTFEEYLRWYKKKGLYKKNGFWVGITDYSRYAAPGEVGEITGSLIRLLEDENINVFPVYAYPPYLGLQKFFFDDKGNSRVDIICGFSFRLGAVSDEETWKNLIGLGVPVLNSIRVSRPISEWEESLQGLGIMEISTRICRPELNGLIEPSVLGGLVSFEEEYSGKIAYNYKPIVGNIKFFIKRIKAWRNLKIKSNKDKKIAIIYYNHSPGKQNVGASYLNVFRSLEVIVKRMRKEGYIIKDELLSEEEIKNLVLQSGRNIGTWAPDELERLIATNRVIRLPIFKYLEWYKELPEDYRRNLEKQWGDVEDSAIMIKDKEIIIPCVDLGNVILLPQPTRGWGDDPMKIYHSPTVWPHHQYTAFYLWLKKEFQADAVIHLGRHGTHEWLPGKQAGLSLSCPPEVLIQDLPNIYPYIVDGLGEGLQAKRRGRGVIIDHLTPVFKKGGIYREYRTLASLIDEYNVASLTKDESLVQEKLKRIKVTIKKLGIDKDLGLKEIDEEAIEEIEHYLIEIGESLIPYGLPAFGLSPEGDALKEMTKAVQEKSGEISLSEIKNRLRLSGILEMKRFIHALEGKYIPAGEGSDPVRNPDAIPTGKNFYGFDAKKIPSMEAYVLGKKAAQDLIEKYLKEKKEYPDKIGIILWSCETQRNEGINEGTILYLLGMKPVWDKKDKVIGVEPIPGTILKRPRIDVHVQSSGLYRDSFPNVLLLLDEAVRKASQLKDVENFIAKHSQKIKEYLLEKGYSEEEAENLSKIRVFSAKPGSYGTKIAELIPASGFWESDEEIADVFINQASFAYGKGIWGKPLKSVYKKNIKDIRITVHSRSTYLYKLMDNDDMFQYLGGLSLAVKSESGNYPEVIVSRQEDRENSYIEDVEKTIGKELRSRYLNPEWIKGMKKENYAGAREMDQFVEYMWGWQVTTPFAIDKTKWEQVYEVYVQDKYDLDLKEFFDEHNPWAIQSISARMLEVIRKGYWDAPEEIKRSLAKEYAISVIEKGIACCHHTCNNPALNQMVINIISLPGLLSPELINQFQTIISKAMGMNLEEAVEKREALQEKLAQVTKEIQQEEKVVKGKKPEKEQIEGYEMVEEKKEDTKLVTSGAAWVVIIIVLGFIALLIIGWLQKK